jgi:hypothetical protein
MTAVATSSPTKKPQQEQPFLCLFPPVAKLVRPSLLRFKLRSQLTRQSHIVQPAPISSTQAINGLVTHWLPSYIADQLFIEMCEAETDDPGGIDGEKISKYYIEAAKYAGRISAGNFEGENAKYKPVFEIHYKDFTPRLQEELQLLLKDSPDTLRRVVQNAVFHIFRARHKRIFFGYIQSEGLNWRFVAD